MVPVQKGHVTREPGTAAATRDRLRSEKVDVPTKSASRAPRWSPPQRSAQCAAQTPDLTDQPAWCLRLITLRGSGFTNCRWGAQIVEFAPYQIAFIANLIIQARVPSENSRHKSK